MVAFQSAVQCLEEFIARNREALNSPGIAIGLTDRGSLLHVGEYGYANLDAQTPVQPHTLFEIGSISKAFTSIVLLQLQEQGLLNIDAPVTQYLPWFKVQSDYEPITLRHLMSHTAGIIMGSDDSPSGFTEVWNLRYIRTTAPPGDMFHYSNSGYKTLGLIIQSVLNQSLAEILTSHILDPLGMTSTKPVITNTSRSHLAIGYGAFYDDRPLPRGGKLAPATWFEADAADGSIASNAEDMCRYMRFLLNRGDGLLSRDSFDQLIAPVIATGDDLHGEYYGLGLSTRQIDGHQVLGHGGGMVGYTADLLCDLDAGLGVVVLTNGPGEPEKISHFALRLLRSIQDHEELPPSFELIPGGFPVEDYVGTYQSGEKTFTLTPINGELHLEFEGDSVVLESIDQDVFYVPHPSFDLYFLRFGRMAGQITEALHGPDWYLHSRYTGEISFEFPPEWRAYTGHYRSYNPWLTNFRVVIQKDSLVLIQKWEKDKILHQTGPGVFRVGSDPRSPEFIQFDNILNGKAMQANLSGGVYSRIITSQESRQI